MVLTSPLQRARRTCELAGFGERALIEPNLAEWDYGEYEGRTTAEIQKRRPGWSLFRDGVPGGETIEQVAARAQAVIDRARRPRATWRCSRTDIFCASWPLAGWACRRMARVFRAGYGEHIDTRL